MNTKLNQSPYHSPHHTPTYSAQMNPNPNPPRIRNSRIGRSRSNTNINNNPHPIVYKMININDDSPPSQPPPQHHYTSTNYPPLSRTNSHHTVTHSLTHHNTSSPPHYAHYSNASQIPPLHTYSRTNYHQINPIHTNKNHEVHRHTTNTNGVDLMPLPPSTHTSRKRNSRGTSRKKQQYLNTAYPFNNHHTSSNNNRKSSKSLSSVSSEEMTNTSVYTSTTCLSSPREADHSHDTLNGPCDGDPFWDYYRTVGNISRANSFELINVMKFISAEHIIKFFLQNWISSRIEPIDLPFAHDAISSKMQYTKRKRNKKKKSAKQRQSVVSNLSVKNLRQHDESSYELKSVKFNPMNRIKSMKSFTMSESGQYTFDLNKNTCSHHLNEAENEDRDSDEDTTDSDEDEGFCAAKPPIVFMHNSNHKSKSRFQIDSVTSSVTGTSVMEGGNSSVVYSSFAKEGNGGDMDDINVNSSSLTKFIRQSLRVSDASCQHPNYFNIPNMVKLYHKYYHEEEAEEEEEEEEDRENKRYTLNDIGICIFSYLDQTSFLNASIVSRSWFYASRFESSRSQITLRLVNVLRYLIKPKDLWTAITSNNDIVCIDALVLQNKRRTIKSRSLDTDSDGSDIDDDEDTSDEEWMQQDILLSSIAKDHALGFNCDDALKPVPSHQHIQNHNSAAVDGNNNNINNNKPFTFPYFFASRCECGLFSSITVLQIDLTIVSNNCLMYFIDDTLYDCFWEMALTLFRIESLQSIDLMLCDPHILLLSYILKNIKSLKISKSELKFPSIGIPKHKFLCISKVIESLSFKCKSLSTHKLTKILNTHFEHYYHPSHHNKTMDIGYIQQQSTSFCYKSLDSYILCRKTIQKPLIFDITHALYYLNRRPSGDVNTVQRLIMSDVRCSSYELEIFLNRNSNALTHIEIQFSKYCVFDPNHYKLMNGMMNGSAPSLTTTSRSNVGHHTFNSTPSGKSIDHNDAEEDAEDNSDEDTGFPDVSALPQKPPSNKSSTMVRIAGYVSEIFDAIVLYLNKSQTRYKEYNNNQKRKKKKKNRNISVLPLNTLAVSFPNHLDDDCLCGFLELFKRLETPCDEIQITNLYLNGLCIVQSMHTHTKKSKLNWMNIFQSHPMERFYLRRCIYIDSFFDNLSKLWSYSLLHLELSLSFDVNSSSSSIKRLFVSLTKCHRLQHLSFEFIQNACYQTRVLRQYSSSNNYGLEDNASNCKVRGTPLPQLPQPLPSQNSTPSADERDRVSLSSNSYSHSHSHHHTHTHTHHHHHHLMEPILDIWWIHQFMTSKNIKKTIQSLRLTFNELSTKKFENATNATPKYTRWNQAHGQILRISDGFRVAVEQLIMSWFAHCPHLIECRMLRKLSTMDTLDSFNDIYNNNNINNNHRGNSSNPHSNNNNNNNYMNPINFDLDISCFDDDESYLNHLDTNDIHHLVLFKIKKWKISNLQYKGDVVGELDKLLMPEIPIG